MGGRKHGEDGGVRNKGRELGSDDVREGGSGSGGREVGLRKGTSGGRTVGMDGARERGEGGSERMREGAWKEGR